LIFSKRKYLDLREQQLVDRYQEQKFEEDAIVLPNTKAALEEEAFAEWLLQRARVRQKE